MDRAPTNEPERAAEALSQVVELEARLQRLLLDARKEAEAVVAAARKEAQKLQASFEEELLRWEASLKERFDRERMALEKEIAEAAENEIQRLDGLGRSKGEFMAKRVIELLLSQEAR